MLVWVIIILCFAFSALFPVLVRVLVLVLSRYSNQMTHCGPALWGREEGSPFVPDNGPLNSGFWGIFRGCSGPPFRALDGPSSKLLGGFPAENTKPCPVLIVWGNTVAHHGLKKARQGQRDFPLVVSSSPHNEPFSRAFFFSVQTDRTLGVRAQVQNLENPIVQTP